MTALAILIALGAIAFSVLSCRIQWNNQRRIREYDRILYENILKVFGSR